MSKNNDRVETIENASMSRLEEELSSIGVDDTRRFVESLIEAAENAETMYLFKNPEENGEYDEYELCPYCTTDFQEALTDSLAKRGLGEGPFATHPYITIKYLGDWGVLLGYEGSKEKVCLSERWKDEMENYLKDSV